MRTHSSMATFGSTLVFLTALVLNPALLQAQIPMDVGIDGSSTTVDDRIETTTRDPLVSTEVILDAGHMHNCIVTASAGTTWPAPGEPPLVGGRYIFDLTRTPLGGVAVAATASARRVDFVDNAGDGDPNTRPVATNLTFFNLSGTHTFTFNARKEAAAAPDLIVTESAISVSCQLSGAI